MKEAWCLVLGGTSIGKLFMITRKLARDLLLSVVLNMCRVLLVIHLSRRNGSLKEGVKSFIPVLLVRLPH